MPSKNFKITIDSILQGRSSLNYFDREGQFRDSLAIDPDLEANTGDNRASGWLVPQPSVALGGNALDDEALWMSTTPKDDNVYVYDRSGKVYTVVLATNTISDLNNGVALSTSSGNGQSYYDNYMYWATNTNVSRRLISSGAITNSYWTSLSLSALGNGVTYPAPKRGTTKYPNHPMHRHVDGKLYIGDVIAGYAPHTGKGAIHYVKTTKTTVEGDTNNGSTYNALDLPYGVWPTDIESYGTDLAISAYEGNTTSGNTRGKRGHVYFWDTTSSSFYKDVELPDPLVSALEFVNGELIAFSGNPGDVGCRVSRYVGGYTFEEIAYLEDTQPPFAGATDHIMSKLVFGGFHSATNRASLWAIGSKIGKITRGVFNIMTSSTNQNTGVCVTSCIIPENTDFTNDKYLIAWRDGNEYGIDRNATTYRNSVFQSEVFKIGKPFEIDKIRFPVAQAIAANMTLTVKLIVDQESTSTTIATINNTTYSGSERFVELSPSVRGKHDCFLEIDWSGSELITVGLPIEIIGHIIEE